MSVTVTVVVPAPPEAAWERWSDIASWPRWNPNCLEAELDGPLAPGTRIDLRLRHPRGRDFYTRPVLTAVEPERELTWQARAPGIRATTRTRLVPEPDGTRMTVEATTEGLLAMTYRMTLTDRAQARMYVDMLDALTEELRA